MAPGITSSTTMKRKTLKSSASVLGLMAGAIGWSGLAHAASEETERQTSLLPDHYRLMGDGVVVFQLEGGEVLSLDPNQYPILEDGLLLITDELAQASMQSLPVMGSIRAQLTSELQPVRSPDGSVVLASDASPLWAGDGPAPRLFEEVDIERYELAQNSSETPTQSEANLLGQVTGAAVGGLSLAGLSLVSGIFGTNPEQATEETTAAASASAPAEFLSDAMFQALTPANARVFTGSSDNSFIGYTAADPTAQDALADAGKGAGNSATFNMSAGGDNLFLAGAGAGASSGTLVYTGGSGSDVLTFGDQFAASGTAVLDLGSDTAAETVTFQGSIGAGSGSVTILNYNYNHDLIDVPAGVTADVSELSNLFSSIIWTDSSGNYTITFDGTRQGTAEDPINYARLIDDIV